MFQRILFAVVLTLSLAVGSSAAAQVILTFAVKDEAGAITVPHGVLRITGSTETGEPFDRVIGFMSNGDVGRILVGGSVPGKVFNSSIAAYPWDNIQPVISVQISDETFRAVIRRFRHWNEGENGGYQLYSRNCFDFLADVATTIGLKLPRHSTLDPNGYMAAFARINPPGSLPGILETPVPNPTAEEIAQTAAIVAAEAAAAAAPAEAPPGAGPEQPASADPAPAGAEPEPTPN